MFVCPICMDIFDTNLENAVTNCGHVFHLQCLNDWYEKDAAKSCPSCRGPANGNSSRIYLQFDIDYEVKLDTLQSELAVLRSKVADSEGTQNSQRQDLEFQIDILETQNKKLEEEQDMGNAEIASLKSSYEHQTKLKAEVDFELDIEKEKSKSLKEEVDVLKSSILMYEKSLQDIKGQLEKLQIEHSKMISDYQRAVCVLNVKATAEHIQELVDEGSEGVECTSTNPKKKLLNKENESHNSVKYKESTKQEEDTADIDSLLSMILHKDHPRVLKERNTRADVNSGIHFTHLSPANQRAPYKKFTSLNASLNSERSSNSSRMNCTNYKSRGDSGDSPKSSRRDCVENKCVVKGVRFDDIQRSAKDFVIALAMNSNFRLHPEDLSAELQQHDIGQDDICSIFVVFKSFEKKQQFLRLQGLPRNIKIVEALSKQNYALFRKAESLYNYGYGFVYHQGGNIFVRRTSYSDPIIIRSVQDIIDLKKR